MKRSRVSYISLILAGSTLCVWAAEGGLGSGSSAPPEFQPSKDGFPPHVIAASRSAPEFQATSSAQVPFSNPVVIVVPTIHRSTLEGGTIDYLSQVLTGLRDDFQRQGPPDGNVQAGGVFAGVSSVDGASMFSWLKVVVLNMHPYSKHPVFDETKAAFAADPLFSFVDARFSVHDPWYGLVSEPDNKNNPWGVPGHEVRQQSCDLVSALRSGQEALLDLGAPSPAGGLVMLVEDDSKPCPGFFAHLRHILHETTQACTPSQKWASISTSYGMNGILFRFDLIEHFLRFTIRNIHRLPPDWGIYKDWWARPDEAIKQDAPQIASAPPIESTLPVDLMDILRGPAPRPQAGMQHLSYRYALFEHLGTHSSFQFRKDTVFMSRTVTPCMGEQPTFGARSSGRRNAFLFPCEGDTQPA